MRGCLLVASVLCLLLPAFRSDVIVVSVGADALGAPSAKPPASFSLPPLPLWIFHNDPAAPAERFSVARFSYRAQGFHHSAVYTKVLNYLLDADVFRHQLLKDCSVEEDITSAIILFESWLGFRTSCGGNISEARDVCIALLDDLERYPSLGSLPTDETTLPAVFLLFPPPIYAYNISPEREIDDVTLQSSPSTSVSAPPSYPAIQLPVVVKVFVPPSPSNSSSCAFLCAFPSYDSDFDLNPKYGDMCVATETLKPRRHASSSDETLKSQEASSDDDADADADPNFAWRLHTFVVPLAEQRVGTVLVNVRCFASELDEEGALRPAKKATSEVGGEGPRARARATVEIVAHFRSHHVFPAGAPLGSSAAASAGFTLRPLSVGLTLTSGLHGGADLLSLEQCRLLSGSSAVSASALLLVRPPAGVPNFLDDLQACSARPIRVLTFDEDVVCAPFAMQEEVGRECERKVKDLPLRIGLKTRPMPKYSLSVSYLLDVAAASGAGSAAGEALDELLDLFMPVLLYELQSAEDWDDVSPKARDVTRSIRATVAELDVLSAHYSRAEYVEIVMHICRLGKTTAFNLDMSNLPNPANALQNYQFSHSPSGVTFPSRYVAEHPFTDLFLAKGARRSGSFVSRTIHPISIPSVPAEVAASKQRHSRGGRPSVVRVAFVSRLSTEKSPASVLLALLSLVDAVGASSVSAFVVGGGTLAPALQAAAEASGLADVVKFLGPLPAERVFPTLVELQVDVLICPGHESFGRVVVEAMSAGIVPLACSGSAKGEMIEHGVNGLLADCTGRKGGKDLGETLADVGRMILGDGIETFELMRLEAKRTAGAERFSEKGFARQYLEQYLELGERRSERGAPG